MPKKLYIGNLSYDVTDEELTQVFSQCGQVSSAKVIRHRDGKSKGFGFVEMPNDDEATHAVDRMKGFDLKGRSLIVDVAREPERGAVRPGFRSSAGSRGRNRNSF